MFKFDLRLMLLAGMCVAIFLGSTETMGQKLSDVVKWNNGKAYLFYDTGQYVRFDIASDQADPGYPKPIANNWLGVWENKIDAALTWTDGKVYFFKGSQYIRYDVAKDQADEGYPADIATNWPGLWDRDIDAAVMWNDGYAYFFKGNAVMRYEVAEKHPPTVHKIRDRFPGLWDRDIDAAVLWDNNTAYFFRGDRYVKYDVVHNKVITGGSLPIKENWRGLSFNQAAYFGWRGYADTSLKFSEFFNHNHTVMARFMTQFPYGYAGPVFGESSNGAYVVGQGNFTAFHRIDAVLVPQSTMLPFSSNKAYFFRGNQVMRFDISGNKADDGYPKPIKAEFPGLWEGGNLDAAMMGEFDRAYFFKGDQYILYAIANREVKAVGKIKDRWPGVWPQDIDAALNWPDGKVYFFKGNRYIRFNPNTNTAEAMFDIKDQWHGLADRHFDSRLDDAVLWPDGRAYFFKWGRFVDYSVNLDRAIGGARSIGDYFPGLNWNTLPQLVMKIGSKEETYATSVTVGRWVDLAVVRSGNTFKLYVNGIFMDPAIVIDPDHDALLPSGENRLRLGRRTDGEPVHQTEAQFYGLIDNVVVFNTALTQQEIKERIDQIGSPIRRHDPNLIAAWIFDERRNPPEAVTKSKIVFRSKTPGMTPSGVTLVSRDADNSTDRGLLPLPFQQVKRQLPFKPGQAWRVTQGMGGMLSHFGQYVFSIDFALAGEESSNKIPNPHDNGSACGEPVFATADGVVTWRVDVGGGAGDENDFDGPNELHIEHTLGEKDSYYHLFTGSITKYIKNEFLPFIKKGQQVGTVGTLNGCHLHTGVFELDKSEVSFPGEFSNYDVSDDEGGHWRRVDRGTPKQGQWVRRRPN